MDSYRSDEAAVLRREVEDLKQKLGRQKEERRFAEERREQFEKERNEARDERAAALAELANVKAGGAPRERLQLAAQTGFNGALYTAGFFSAALMAVFFLAACFSSLRGCVGPGEAEENATGVITDRYHYQTRTYTTCSGGGGRTPRVCTTHVIPEHWTVRVAHDAHEREVRLSHEDWDMTQVGAPWCERPPCEPILVTEER